MPKRPQKYRLIALFSLTMMLIGCGGGTSGSTSGSTTNVEFLVNYMKEWYLWNDQIPATANANQYATHDAVLAGLRVKEDKFSSISTEADFNSFFTAGQLVGYGFSYLKLEAGLVLQQVQPLSPAYTAGLRRGDEILSIDGKSISDIGNPEAVSNAIGPNQAGISGTFQVRSPNLPGAGFQPARSLTMIKASYPVSYVFAANTHDSTKGKVGYIHFYSFSGANQSAWTSALDKVMAEGAQHLILDLRDNTGGVIADAVLLASSLGPKQTDASSPNPINGKLAVRLEHNAQKTNLNQNFSFSPQTFSGRIDQLVILTSTRTCSASELLIQALKPFRTVKTLGGTTCGKPYGSTPTTFSGYVYSILSFQNKNADGEGGYINGLAPTCAEQDNYLRNMGDAQENLLLSALQLIETGQCSSSSVQPKSATASQANLGYPRAEQAHLRGIEKESGFQ